MAHSVYNAAYCDAIVRCVSLSRGSAEQKQLNGSRSWLEWKLLGIKAILYSIGIQTSLRRAEEEVWEIYAL